MIWQTLTRRQTRRGEPDRRDAPGERPAWKRVWARLPRTESVLLFFSLLGTLGAKLVTLRRQGATDLKAAIVEAGLPDVIFFAAIALIFALLYLVGWRALVARLTLLAAVIIAFWSIINAAWLIATGVQLQPGIIAIVVHDPKECWPTVEEHLSRNLRFVVPISVLIGLCGLWCFWRLIRTAAIVRAGKHHVVRAGCALAVLLLATIWQYSGVRGGGIGYSAEALAFSSHWYALARTASRAGESSREPASARMLPRAGEREVAVPRQSPKMLPNVVIIFLESVSYASTSVGDESRTTTPRLAALADEGVEFALTRVLVPQTGKAWWSALTGSTPDLGPDYAESVLVDEPYESLATLLGRCGYRSAFFEMSKGTFECAPGFFANLDFDRAWFRENLEDESAHLGYMNGDDFRMLDPMFAWVDEQSDPFLLVTITSVGHDPYDLPAWYDREPAEDRYGRYLQAVEFTDEFLAEMLDRLDRRGLQENTLVCVMGDHGEGFRPEARFGRWAPFEEALRVPWVIRWPGHLEPGRRIEWPCSQLDLTPTILALLGFGIEQAGFDGVDALRPTDPDRRLYFSTWYRNSPVGFVQGSRKFVYWPYTDKLFEYDLAADPDEQSPRIIDGSEKERVIAEIRRWEEESQFVFPPRRFREKVLFEHWQTFSSGRNAWAYYLP